MVVEEVDPAGAAAGSLTSGDVIVEVDRHATRSVEQFLAATLGALHRQRPLLFRVHRGDEVLFVTLNQQG